MYIVYILRHTITISMKLFVGHLYEDMDYRKQIIKGIKMKKRLAINNNTTNRKTNDPSIIE